MGKKKRKHKKRNPNNKRNKNFSNKDLLNNFSVIYSLETRLGKTLGFYGLKCECEDSESIKEFSTPTEFIRGYLKNNPNFKISQSTLENATHQSWETAADDKWTYPIFKINGQTVKDVFFRLKETNTLSEKLTSYRLKYHRELGLYITIRGYVYPLNELNVSIFGEKDDLAQLKNREIAKELLGMYMNEKQYGNGWEVGEYKRNPVEKTAVKLEISPKIAYKVKNGAESYYVLTDELIPAIDHRDKTKCVGLDTLELLDLLVSASPKIRCLEYEEAKKFIKGDPAIVSYMSEGIDWEKNEHGWSSYHSDFIYSANASSEGYLITGFKLRMVNAKGNIVTRYFRVFIDNNNVIKIGFTFGKKIITLNAFEKVTDDQDAFLKKIIYKTTVTEKGKEIAFNCIR